MLKINSVIDSRFRGNDIGNMKFLKYIFILPFLCWAWAGHAQEPQEIRSMPEQWQMSLDGIKTKAQSLLIVNNGLQLEFRQLKQQLEELQQEVDEQQNKNDQLKLSLNDTHALNGQKEQLEELNKDIRIKRQEVHLIEEQWGNLKRKQSALEIKNQQLKHKLSQKGLDQQDDNQEVSSSDQSDGDDQLNILHKQLDDQNKKEALLADEFETIKSPGSTQGVSADAIEAQNKDLEAHLDELLLQKLQHERNAVDPIKDENNELKYSQLKKRKDEVVASIKVYEMRMDELKESSLLSLAWSKNKKILVHEMVLADASNNKMRDTIKVLREDIEVLRDQVARLERRVDFVQGSKLQ